MTTHHEAQEKAKLNTMEVEDVVVDISQRQFVASVQQRLLVFIMGEALAEAAPGVSNNFEAKRFRRPSSTSQLSDRTTKKSGGQMKSFDNRNHQSEIPNHQNQK